MKNFFRSLTRRGVDALLISGQATVLYGAAPFTEDVDLWIHPDARNCARLQLALADVDARVYKLTPPMAPRHVRRGHGFHFVIPNRETMYLDVMGRPPRVGPYGAAARRARTLPTPWGRVRVASPEDVVLLKKTRRLADYEVISNLVRRRVEEDPSRPAALIRWALLNSFRAEDLAWLRDHPRSPRVSRAAVRALPSLDRCRRLLAGEIAALQRRDTAYWRPIVRELRELRRAGKLLAEGASVPAARGLKARR